MHVCLMNDLFKKKKFMNSDIMLYSFHSFCYFCYLFLLCQFSTLSIVFSGCHTEFSVHFF